MVARVGVGGLAVLLCLSACSASDSSAEAAQTSSEPASSTASPGGPGQLPEAQALDEVTGSRTYTAKPFPDWVVVAGGSAWVANVDGGVGRYDVATARPLTSVKAAGRLEVCTGMGAWAGSLWVADCSSGRLVRFDLHTGKTLATLSLPVAEIQEEGTVAAGPEGVFVVGTGGGQIVRVDPSTNRVVDVMNVPPGAAGVRDAFGSLWVTYPLQQHLLRIDPDSGAVDARIRVGVGAYFQDAGFGSVWVLNNLDARVVRIDPRTSRVIGRITVSETPVNGGDLSVGGDSVWARVSDVLVSRVDPASNRVVARFGDVQGSGSADADGSAVWISAHDAHAVYRVPVD